MKKNSDVSILFLTLKVISGIIFFANSLEEELIACGIMTNYGKLDNGIWDGDIDTSQVFNFDEMPQFINYGIDATQSGHVYATREESCKKMIQENRESVTICPIVSLAGTLTLLTIKSCSSCV